MANSNGRVYLNCLIDYKPSNALAGHGEVPIRDIDKFCKIAGLIPCSKVYYATRFNKTLDVEIPPGHFGVQIHYINNHYLTSQQKDNIISVFDSLPHANRIQQLRTQLNLVYPNARSMETKAIRYIVSQLQGRTSDCGPFAAANAVLLLRGINPTSVCLKQSEIRQHMLKCLQTSEIHLFPMQSTTYENTWLQQYLSMENTNENRSTAKPKTCFKSKEITEKNERENKRKYKNQVYRKTGKVGEAMARAEKRKFEEVQHSECTRNAKGIGNKLAKEIKKNKVHDTQAHTEKRVCEVIKKSRIQITSKLEADLEIEQTRRGIHRAKERERKDRWRKQRSLLQAENEREKNKTRINNLRSDPTYRKNEKEGDRTTRAEKRKDVETRKNERNRNATAMCNKRKVGDSKNKEQDLNTKARAKKRTDPEVRKRDRIQNATSMGKKRKDTEKIYEEQNRNTKSRAKKRTDAEVRKKERIQNATQMAGKRKDTERKREEQNRNTKARAEKRTDAEVRKKERVQNATQMANKRKDQDKKSKEKEKNTLAKRNSRSKVREKKLDIEFCTSTFHSLIKQGPNFECISCKRLLYKNSVINFRAKNYSMECLSKFIKRPNLEDSNKYICKNCHGCLKKGKMPPLSEVNGLETSRRPLVLSEMTSLESSLVSLKIPFMKIISLPKGKQRAVHGAVVNVPSNVQSVCNQLPRTPNESGIIPVKLKRRLQYKGHVLYQQIRPNKVKEGLDWLKENNPLYKSVAIDKTFGQSIEGDNTITAIIEEKYRHEKHAENATEDSESSESDSTILDEQNDENLELRGLPFDTCLQPEDGAVSGQEIFNVAPAEGNTPVSIFTDGNSEVEAFPTLFPTGKGGFHEKRNVKLSPKKYYSTRLMSSDTRFATSTEYLFYAQYFCEYKHLIDNIGIALRKKKANERDVSAGQIKSGNFEMLFQFDGGYKFMKTIPGTPAYWQNTLYDALAMVRQLGPFSFFVTFSAADLRWPEAIQIVAKQYGTELSEEDIKNLSWEARCEWIRRNPVTVARQFNFRFEQFYKQILLSPAKPIGEITDYLMKTEFQQRGSPHIHALFWIKDAPEIGKMRVEDIVVFIDTYIACCIPNNTSPLKELVESVQVHRCSQKCKTKNSTCRFAYPKYPCDRTLICGPIPPLGNIDDTPGKHTMPEYCNEYKTTAKSVMHKVHKQLEDPHYVKTLTNAEFLKDLGVDDTTYSKSLVNSTSKLQVHLQRKPSEIYVNNYNAALLTAWRANMDIQFALDMYACIVYLLSYVCKSEKNLSELMSQAIKEKGNHETNKKRLQRLGNVFINNRELSAQEATYRALSLPLKRLSRHVMFIQTSFAKDRIAVLKPMTTISAMDDEDTDIFCASIIDKYASRPDCIAYMSLIKFASVYTYDTGSAGWNKTETECPETSELDTKEEAKRIESNLPQKIRLKNDLGTMKLRKKAAVIRTHKISKEKEPEKFFFSQLLLHKPWQKETDLKESFNSYEEAFNFNYETMKDTIHEFEPNADIMESIIHDCIENYGNVTDLTEDADEFPKSDEETDDIYPAEDLGQVEAVDISSEMQYSPSIIHSVSPAKEEVSDEEYYEMVRSLNSEQRYAYDFVFDWCLKYTTAKDGEKPSAFQLFVTGGAGTGKSHCIKAIFHMANRMLKRPGDDPCAVYVLRTAPTGTAAFNINGITIHHALALKLTSAYENCLPLSSETLASLRKKYSYLKILIIDEISMVGSRLLHDIHKRLCEISGLSSSEFGNISVLAVGDLYQLPPVNQTPIFGFPSTQPYAALAQNLWKDNFSFIELKAIMRQVGDTEFAEILNRLRNGNSVETDFSKLESRVIEYNINDPNYPTFELHVFSTNAMKNAHNTQMLEKIDGQSYKLLAKDTKIVLHKSITDPSTKNAKRGQLEEEITVKKGCRVMLVLNVDVEDGLCNGALGNITAFDFDTKNEVKGVWIQFDNMRVGLNRRRTIQNKSNKNATYITKEQVMLSSRNNKAVQTSRVQFPIVVAFATTIHKTQGMTLDKIVVSLDGFSVGGMAYVALSRPRTLNGLYLLSIDKKKIKTNRSVTREMERLRSTRSLNFQQPNIEENSIVSLNTRSLVSHYKDIIKSDVLSAQIIGICETWLSNHHSSSAKEIQDYTFYRRDGSVHGGVAIYVSSRLKSQLLEARSYGLETLSVIVKSNTVVTVIYRPPSFPVKLFIKKFEKLLRKLETVERQIVCGDFNTDFSKSDDQILEILKKFGLIQRVTASRVNSTRFVDAIFSNFKVSHTGTLSMYFTDHKAIWCSID